MEVLISNIHGILAETLLSRQFHAPIKAAPWLWALLLLCLLPPVTGRAEVVSREYPLKAVFLLNFAQFTDWPTNSFDDADSPFVMGVLGNDPFGSVLDGVLRSESWKGHKIIVERFRRVEDVKTCHILFICQSETARLDAIVAHLKGRPVLTVSDIEGSAYRGVAVRFLTDNNKIHLQINVDSLKDAGLNMSSKVLRVAEIVTREKK